MRIKIIKGNDLKKVENLVNDFISDIKVNDIKIDFDGKDYIILILYFDLI